MIRRIIEIDEAACTGCGLCVSACHEGAIGLVGGKARLLRDDYCDGLGDCLPTCPTGAITFVEREADAYDEVAVQARMAAKSAGAHQAAHEAPIGGCPGSLSRFFAAENNSAVQSAPCESSSENHPSQLAQWPVEIKLVPVRAPYFAGADVLVAADCTAFAYADFHRDFMQDKITIIGCPKLDAVNYAEKLADIFTHNDIASITVACMEVPCCGGLEHAARAALELSGKDIPFRVATISTRGALL